jgi:RNA polymerase sigma factor (sigma-70 family)
MIDAACERGNPMRRLGRTYGVARIGVPVERLDDQALLAGYADGVAEVAVAFVRRFQGHVYGVALAIVGESALAEDIAQLAFERAWKSAGRYDVAKAGVKTWLTAITRNLAIDSLRVRRPVPVDPVDLIRLLGSAEDEPPERAIGADRAATLRTAIRALPLEQGRAIVMAGMYRMTAEEVSIAEGIPLGTAKTRIRAGLRKLRDDVKIRESRR